MLILSKFHDYYDTAIGVGGIDKTCIYRRITEICDYEHKLYETLLEMLHIKPEFRFKDLNHWDITLLTIIFCGRLYRGIKFTSRTKTWYSITNKIADYYYYEYNPIFMNRFVSKKKHIPFLKAYFNANGSEIYKDRMIELELPIVVCEHTVSITSHFYNEEITINPNLKEFKFFRIYDPFTVFQEISMFIGNIATKGNDTVKIQDRDQIVKKGFDLVSSFRREKGEKKPRRRKRKEK